MISEPRRRNGNALCWILFGGPTLVIVWHYERIDGKQDQKELTQISQVILEVQELVIIAPIWKSLVHFHEDFLQPNYLLEAQASAETMNKS